jgi:hypothetical protein
MNYKVSLNGYTKPYSKIGKLNKQKVKEIFVLRGQKFSHEKIAEIIGVSTSNIGLVLNGKTWTQII